MIWLLALWLGIGTGIYAAIEYVNRVGKLPPQLSIRFEMNQAAFLVVCVVVGPAVLPVAIWLAWKDERND